MFVEKMKFPMPVADGFPTHADKAEAAFSVLKAMSEEEAAAFLKAKMEEEVAAFVKAKAKAEEEAAVIVKAKPEEGMVKAGCGSKRKAEEDREQEAAEDESEEDEDEMAKAKEAEFLKAKAYEEVMKASFEWGDDEVPYDKVCHESDEEEDMEMFMARIEARWDVFIKEEEARFPGLTYRVDLPGEYSVNDPDDSDTEEDYYRRKLEREKAANVVV